MVAILAATGSRSEAIALVRTMKSAHLTDAEYRLVYELTNVQKRDIRSPQEKGDESDE